jgi:hypothetical protein
MVKKCGHVTCVAIQKGDVSIAPVSIDPYQMLVRLLHRPSRRSQKRYEWQYERKKFSRIINLIDLKTHCMR